MIPLEDLSPIAQPLAQKKMLKKLHKTIKKGSFLSGCLLRLYPHRYFVVQRQNSVKLNGALRRSSRLFVRVRRGE